MTCFEALGRGSVLQGSPVFPLGPKTACFRSSFLRQRPRISKLLIVRPPVCGESAPPAVYLPVNPPSVKTSSCRHDLSFLGGPLPGHRLSGPPPFVALAPLSFALFLLSYRVRPFSYGGSPRTFTPPRRSLVWPAFLPNQPPSWAEDRVLSCLDPPLSVAERLLSTESSFLFFGLRLFADGDGGARSFSFPPAEALPTHPSVP